MRNILSTANIETFKNQYIFKENDKLNKKYYVVLTGLALKKVSTG